MSQFLLPVHGLGYAWSPSVLNVSVGDTVTWHWQAHPFLQGIGYRVFSVSSPGSVIYDGKGFTNGREKSVSGMFQFCCILCHDSLSWI